MHRRRCQEQTPDDVGRVECPHVAGQLGVEAVFSKSVDHYGRLSSKTGASRQAVDALRRQYTCQTLSVASPDPT